MNKEDRLRALQDFLDWLSEYTYYEIGEDVQSDYGDGENSFYKVSDRSLLGRYGNWLELDSD